jgi:hypothetical protein
MTWHGSLFAVCASTFICFLIGCGSGGNQRGTGALTGDEEARVTSPDGRLDAVLLREDGGGAPGGWEWYLYIVAKGSPVDERNAQPILNAGTLTEEKVVWTQAHLVEFHYDIADFNQFRNLWGSDEIHNFGNAGDGEYFVEVRLAPTRPNFSLLTPDGRFRSRE